MLEDLYRHAKFDGARISPAAVAAKNVGFFVCLSVCLSVRHAPWLRLPPRNSLGGASVAAAYGYYLFFTVRAMLALQALY